MPVLYMVHPSPPSRAVLMCAKALDIELELKMVNLLTGDHLKPEYVKINPQHTIPTLVDDDGFIIWESHAIMVYLISKYGKNDQLYPKDIKLRAVIDQRLHFDTGVLFARLGKVVRPLLKASKNLIDPEHIEELNEAYGFLEVFLEGKKYVAGPLSIADYSLITTVTSIAGLVPVDPAKYPNIIAWIKRMEELPEYEANKEGVEQFIALMKSRL